MNFLLIISAPSGAGKTTLCQRLLRDIPSLELSISSTTRAPRGQEHYGEDYYFLTEESFQKSIQLGEFAEWANVHGNYYGTSRKVLDLTFSKNKNVLLDIDVQGAKELRKSYPEQSILIFIAPPSLQELEKRLRSRGTDPEETIQKRIKNAEIEMEEASLFDLVLVNDDLEKCYQHLSSYAKKKLGFNHG